MLCYENNLIYPVYVWNKKFEKCMDLLMITEENKSYYAYVKNVNRFICNNTQNNNKKHFRKYCLQYFSKERVLVDHKII